MNRLQITKEAQSKTGKSRQFAAIYLSSIRADTVWDGGMTDTGRVERPVYLAVAGTDAALRPFLANLRLGRRADILGDNGNRNRYWDESLALQLLKSVRYDTAVQHHGEQTVVQFMHPEVWPVEPGMIDPSRVDFLSVTPAWWHTRQMAALAADRELVGRVLAHAHRLNLGNVPYRSTPLSDDDLLDMLPDAARFIQYLDRRTRRPLPNDPCFYLQAYVRALAERLASRSKEHEYRSRHSWAYHKWAVTFREFETTAAGWRPGVVFRATVDETDAFLAAQARLYTEAYHGPA